MNGLPATGCKGFGRSLDRSPRRVPLPPTRSTNWIVIPTGRLVLDWLGLQSRTQYWPLPENQVGGREVLFRTPQRCPQPHRPRLRRPLCWPIRVLEHFRHGARASTSNLLRGHPPERALTRHGPLRRWIGREREGTSRSCGSLNREGRNDNNRTTLDVRSRTIPPSRREMRPNG